MAWEKQKALLKQDIPTPDDIRNIAFGISDVRNRSLFICLYLTAGRITEVLSLRRKDVELIVMEEREIVLFHMDNRKHRTKFRKDIPVAVDTDGDLLEAALEYINKKTNPEELLFPISKIRAWQILQKTTGTNCHFLRHCKLSHLAIYKDFSDQQLVQFSGWSDSRPSRSYITMKFSDLVRKL